MSLRFGRHGENATSTEAQLIATPPPGRVTTPSEQLLMLADRLIEAGLEAGANARLAHVIAAEAVAAMLDEWGGSRVHLPRRRSFFYRLAKPQLARMACKLALHMSTEDVAQYLGVSRRTVQRFLTDGDSDSLPLSPDARQD